MMQALLSIFSNMNRNQRMYSSHIRKVAPGTASRFVLMLFQQ